MGWYILASIGCLIISVVFLASIFIDDSYSTVRDTCLVWLIAFFLTAFAILQAIAVVTNKDTITVEQYLLNPQDYQVDKVYRDSVIIEYKVSKKEKL